MKVEIIRSTGQDIGWLDVGREIGCGNCRKPKETHAGRKCLLEPTMYEKGDDPKYYNDSTLLHQVKKALIAQGYDVIKKRMQKDGHMYGDETTQYIRTRGKRPGPDSFYVWDRHYAVRTLYQRWNEDGGLRLEINFNIWNKGEA
jgi:hypothetical protein